MKEMQLIYNTVTQRYIFYNSKERNPNFKTDLGFYDAAGLVNELKGRLDLKRKSLLHLIDIPKDTLERIRNVLKGTKIKLDTKTIAKKGERGRFPHPDGIKVGDEVYIPQGDYVSNFKSDILDKTFEEIFFVFSPSVSRKAVSVFWGRQAWMKAPSVFFRTMRDLPWGELWASKSNSFRSLTSSHTKAGRWSGLSNDNSTC